MKFSDKIVRLRKIKGITQDDFASAVGVSRQAVYKWECGQSYPEALKLVEIKALFGISIDDLLDDSFEIALPEKKKRRRISKARIEKIEKSVIEENISKNTEEAETKETETTVTEMVAEPNAPVYTEQTVVEAMEKIVEEVAADTVKAEEEKITTPETATPAIKEEVAKIEEKPIEEPKKRGFFSRLFGRK